MLNLAKGVAFQGVGVVFNYVTSILVAKYYDPAYAGKVFWYLNFIILCSMVSIWGSDSWIVKEYRSFKCRFSSTKVIICGTDLIVFLVLIISVIAFNVTFFVRNETLLFSFVISIAVVCYSLNLLVSIVFEAKYNPSKAIVVRVLATYAVTPIGLFLISSTNILLREEYVFILILTSCALSVVLSVSIKELCFFIKRATNFHLTSACQKWKILREKKDYFGVSFLGYIFVWQYLFISEFYLEYEEIARFVYFLKVSTVISLPLLVVGVLFSPKIASENDFLKKKDLHKKSMLFSSVIGFFPFLFSVYFSDYFVLFLDENYSIDESYYLLCLSQYLVMIFGAQTGLMVMGGMIKQYNTILLVSVLLSITLILIIGESNSVFLISLIILFSQTFKLLANQTIIYLKSRHLLNN
jgi:hypothetical protein